MCDWDLAPPAIFAGSLHHSNSQTRDILSSHWLKYLVISVALSVLHWPATESALFHFFLYLALTSPPQSHFIYLHSFLQLMSFGFSFSLASLFLNRPKLNMEELDHNTDLQHVTQSISLFSLFPPCFPFHNKNHKGHKAEMISQNRFFQHPAQWGPILLYTMLVSNSTNFFNERRTIGIWKKDRYPEA